MRMAAGLLGVHLRRSRAFSRPLLAPSTSQSWVPPAGCRAPCLQAHEALRRAEEQAAAEEEAAAAGASGQHRQERLPHYEPRERERWDCESVLRWGCQLGWVRRTPGQGCSRAGLGTDSASATVNAHACCRAPHRPAPLSLSHAPCCTPAQRSQSAV